MTTITNITSFQIILLLSLLFSLSLSNYLHHGRITITSNPTSQNLPNHSLFNFLLQIHFLFSFQNLHSNSSQLYPTRHIPHRIPLSNPRHCWPKRRRKIHPSRHLSCSNLAHKRHPSTQFLPPQSFFIPQTLSLRSPARHMPPITHRIRNIRLCCWPPQPQNIRNSHNCK